MMGRVVSKLRKRWMGEWEEGLVNFMVSIVIVVMPNSTTLISPSLSRTTTRLDLIPTPNHNPL